MNIADGRDIVMLALSRWDGPISGTALCLAKELSKTNRVFYIDNPFTIRDLFSERHFQQIRKRILSLLFGIKPCRGFPGIKNLFYVTPPVVLPINFLPKGKMYSFFNRINNYRITSTLKKVCRQERIQNFIFLNSLNPFYLANIIKFNPACTVYYNGDYMSESKYIGKHGAALERNLMRQFNFTISTSRFLQKYSASYSSSSYYLPNAADFSLFSSTVSIGSDKRPIELRPIKTKIVGYIGHLEDRTNFDLLLGVIKLNPDKSFLFIGPIGTTEFIKKGFDRLSNVFSIGSKNIQELPDYLRFIDCAIIPYKKNRLTEGIYPLKINEYLAAGRPVVCTSFSEDILEFKDIIQIADSELEFSRAIQAEIESDSTDKVQKRISRAGTNTWENRAIEFKEILSNHLV